MTTNDEAQPGQTPVLREYGPTNNQSRGYPDDIQDTPFYEYPPHGFVVPPLGRPDMPGGAIQTPWLPGQRPPQYPYWSPPPPRRPNKWLLIGGALLAIVIVGAIVLSMLQRGGNSLLPPLTTTEFREAKCPFSVSPTLSEKDSVRCGYVTVPEDRTQLNSKKIRLAVAIFQSPTKRDDSLPMLYLAGGPGGGSLKDLGSYITSDNIESITMDHDLILLDQRGTGYSRPLLECDEFTDLSEELANSNISDEEANKRYIDAAKECRDRHHADGINLNSYTTMDNAADIHDVIQALDYPKVNLYGVSYGTRLAQTVMRLYPDDLRSVILDSTVPLDSNLFGSLAKVTQNAYDVFFKGCADNPDCKQQYPDLENNFYQTVKKLNEKPATFTVSQMGEVTMKGDDFADWLFSALYVTSIISMLPSIIEDVSDGQYELFGELYAALIFSDGISDAMYYSVECGEDLAFLTQEDLTKSVEILRPEIRDGIRADLLASYDVCKAWGQKPVPQEQKQPIQSNIPTLVLAGQYDPITPVSNGETVVKTLKKSYLFVFPGIGHGVYLTDRCPNRIMESFLRNPDTRPSSSCVESMEGPDFL